MQNGSLRRVPRRRGPDVWAFRWREPGSDGRRVHRRIVIGTIEQFTNESAAAQAIIALRREIKSPDCRLSPFCGLRSLCWTTRHSLGSLSGIPLSQEVTHASILFQT